MLVVGVGSIAWYDRCLAFELLGVVLCLVVICLRLSGCVTVLLW